MYYLVLLSAADGATWEAIAAACGVATSTAQDWCDEDSPRYDHGFSVAVTRAKAKADDLVQSSLFKTACGYDYEEDACSPGIGVVKVSRYSRPEVGAMKLWLTNRRPAEWADKQTHEMNDPILGLLAMMRGDDGAAVPKAE